MLMIDGTARVLSPTEAVEADDGNGRDCFSASDCTEATLGGRCCASGTGGGKAMGAGTSEKMIGVALGDGGRGMYSASASRYLFDVGTKPELVTGYCRPGAEAGAGGGARRTVLKVMVADDGRGAVTNIGLSFAGACCVSKGSLETSGWGAC